MNEQISEKDYANRDLILNGDVWKVIFRIGAPLALYQWVNQFFKFVDTIMASYVGSISVSAVAYIAQITFLLSSVGAGLAVGASIRINEAYGAKKYELVKKQTSTLLATCGIIAICVICLIPFSEIFLRFMNTPEEFILEGKLYFSIILIDIVLVLFNTAYIAIERARGNSSRILTLNIISTILKLGLNCIFIYVLNKGIAAIALATVLSNLVIFCGFICNIVLNRSAGIFSFSFKAVCFNKKVFSPMASTGIPVIFEKAFFQFGKILVNNLSAAYGTLVVGALGISNNIGGLTTNPQNGLQDAGASIISQNLGAGNKKRCIEILYKLIIVNVAIGIIGTIITYGSLDYIVGFLSPNDVEFAHLISDIYKYEVTALIPLGIYSSVMALIYGCGFTKLTLAINFLRIFLLRIPPLWVLLNYTDIGSESVGIVMMFSNIATGVLAVILGIWIISRFKQTMA